MRHYLADDSPIRVGIAGLGANTRLRHVPGLRACDGVEITAVCNRTPASTEAAAREFNIPRTFGRWGDLVADSGIDAVVIGTWPYLHAPITLAALAAGKHVLTEARMAMNADEARRMLAASRARSDLVAQIVPSPIGLYVHQVMKELIASGFLGELREVVVIGTTDSLADPAAPLGWRQKAEYSGVNVLSLGILHETLIRWVPGPERVFAQAKVFIPQRPDPESGGALRAVGTPDSVQVLTELPNGARGLYHFSGVARFGPGHQIHLYGSDGTLKFDASGERERLLGARTGDEQLREIPVPPDKAGGWRVEAEFVDAIRGRGTVQFTDLVTGVCYMEFTGAVSRSAREGRALDVRGVATPR